MKITVLAENTAVSGEFISEHGLSLFIETENHRILFDMGQTDAFFINAQKLGVELEKADIAVLSHGHYDHGGGLSRFLEINSRAKIYLSERAFGNHYNASGKYIGLDKSLQTNERLVFVERELEIADGISLYSRNEDERKFPTDSFGLGIERNGETVPDDFFHEQYLLIEENGRKILFSGCSHKGVLNIEEWFSPDAFVGGFHLSKLDVSENADELTDIARRLDSFGTKYFTAHCTGVEQCRFLKGIMGDSLSYLSTGMSILL